MNKTISKPKVKEIKVGELYYDKNYRMLFLRYEFGLEPIKRECTEIDLGDELCYEGIDIEPDTSDLYYLFILFTRVCTDRFDENGKRLTGFLETFQWHLAFNTLRQIAALKSEDALLAAARQGGKSWFLRMILVFSNIFMKHVTYVKEGMFMSAWASPTAGLSKDHYSKMKDLFKYGIKLYNELFPEMPLVDRKEDGEALEKNMKVYTLGRQTLSGIVQPWSKMYLISTDKRSVNPGYTLHLLITDESQLMDNYYVNENLMPMTNRTGGVVLTAGTTLPDSKNLLYNVYKKTSIPTKRKFLLNVIEVYKSIALRSNEEADDYWSRFLKEANDWGLYSDYLQSQYFVSFNIKGDRWITIEQLEETGSFNIARTGLKRFLDSQTRHFKESVYKIASFDSAKKGDFAALILGVIQPIEDDEGYFTYKSYLTDFIIINDEELTVRTILDPDKMNEKVANICVKNGIDMVVYEASANQTDRAFYLQKIFNKRKKGTKVIPIDYGGRNKEKLFLKAEREIAGGKVSLPVLENTRSDKGYNEFIEEVKIFKKTYTGSTIKFAAPDVRGLHDDFISSFAQFVYLPHLIEHKQLDNRTVGLGRSIEFDYAYDWYRYGELPEDLNKTERVVFSYT